MCASCVSSAEVIVLNAAGGLALAKGAVARVGDALAGRHPTERRQAAWDANSAFVLELGLDPAAVLGPRPVAPAPMPTPPIRTPVAVARRLGLRAAAV